MQVEDSLNPSTLGLGLHAGESPKSLPLWSSLGAAASIAYPCTAGQAGTDRWLLPRGEITACKTAALIASIKFNNIGQLHIFAY